MATVATRHGMDLPLGLSQRAALSGIKCSRLARGEAASMRVLIKLDILSAYDRVRSCYENIADALLGGKGRATAT